MKIRLSSRQSELAQFQAFQVGRALENLNLGIQVDYYFRESLGDKNLQDPLWKMPEKGVFTEDFYLDLVSDKTDLVVHSWKDLPTEEKPETFITATLPRADQRDLLLFKKSSVENKNIKIFSSSPRRAHNLTDFLLAALPARIENIKFKSVRGNIQTRVRKWLADEDTDGLILAKAAFDRLLTGPFAEIKSFLQDVLAKQLWMVLPLQFNPNAAAQGALAIEIKRSRKDLIDLFAKINCEATFKMATDERNILRSFGGGCHLALGMSCLSRPYGELEIVKGLTPAGEKINIRKFKAKRELPKGVKRERLDFTAERSELPQVNLSGLNAIYVAKTEAWSLSEKFDGLVWASGNETWKKLAKRGVWVYGSNESLGEAEDTRVDHFFTTALKWGRLSHDHADPRGNKKHLNGYSVNLILDTTQLPQTKSAFVWMSSLEFDMAFKKFPEIKEHYHICGPGRTYESLAKKLGSEENLYIDLLTYS